MLLRASITGALIFLLRVEFDRYYERCDVKRLRSYEEKWVEIPVKRIGTLSEA